MSRLFAVPLPLALCAVAAGAQPVRKDAAPETAAFVVQLGSDTIAVERWTRAGGRVEGDVFNRGPTPRVTHYVVTLDGAGRPQRVEFATRAPDGSTLPNVALSAAMTFRGSFLKSSRPTCIDVTRRPALRTASANSSGVML